MDIIPLPMEVDQWPGQFRLRPETVIEVDGPNRGNADHLRILLSAPTGFSLPVRNLREPSGRGDRPGGAPREGKNSIRLFTDPELAPLGPESYQLLVTPQVVSITASTPAGIFYGIQSLRQLLPAEIESRQFLAPMDWAVPSLLIRDRPRFSWRGTMLDEGRHFQGKETVLRTIDLMALQKLNRLHWHLTEDQGWRVEIKRYPRLTEIGSHRAGTARTFTGEHDGLPHTGFYDQEDIQAIVKYAAQRNVTIIPEIEMPGHSLAALASYPELSCSGGPFAVATHFGIFPDIFCAGNEATFIFLQNVLLELLALFPSRFIHIGGDEAPKQRWRKCPRCQRRIREQGLKDEHALQVYFTNRVAAFLDAHDRRAIGWSEILQPGLVGSAVVQYWIGKAKRVAGAVRKQQREVIISSYLETYLDHSYRLTPLRRAYRFDPLLPGLTTEEEACLLGLEPPLWTEWVPTRARLDYQTYPRLCAYAETSWTAKEKKDYRDFRRRLAIFLGRLDRLGVRYAPLAEADPGWWDCLFGMPTIAQPQTKTA